jgi:hypothetical protein
VVGYHGDVFVIQEDSWEGFRESQEAVESVLLDNGVLIIDKLVEMAESVDENGLDVFFIWVEAKTAEEQGACLFLACPIAVDDPRNTFSDLID